MLHQPAAVLVIQMMSTEITEGIQEVVLPPLRSVTIGADANVVTVGRETVISAPMTIPDGATMTMSSSRKTLILEKMDIEIASTSGVVMDARVLGFTVEMTSTTLGIVETTIEMTSEIIIYATIADFAPNSSNGVNICHCLTVGMYANRFHSIVTNKHCSTCDCFLLLYICILLLFCRLIIPGMNVCVLT